MSSDRIMATPDGPRVTLTVDDYRLLAAAIGRLAELAPDGTRRDPRLRDLRATLLLAVSMADRGLGFSTETSGGPDFTTPRHDAGYVSSSVVADALGISTQALGKRLRAGEIPRARQVGGRWLIPTEMIEEHRR